MSVQGSLCDPCELDSPFEYGEPVLVTKCRVRRLNADGSHCRKGCISVLPLDSLMGLDPKPSNLVPTAGEPNLMENFYQI